MNNGYIHGQGVLSNVSGLAQDLITGGTNLPASLP